MSNSEALRFCLLDAQPSAFSALDRRSQLFGAISACAQHRQYASGATEVRGADYHKIRLSRRKKVSIFGSQLRLRAVNIRSPKDGKSRKESCTILASASA